MTEEVPKVDSSGTVDVDKQTRVDPNQLRELEKQLKELEQLGEAPKSTYRINHPFDTRIGTTIRGESPAVSGGDLKQS